MKNPPIHEGKLDRAAAAEALRNFLADTIRTGSFRLTLHVSILPENTSAAEGEAKFWPTWMVRTRNCSWSAAAKC